RATGWTVQVWRLSRIGATALCERVQRGDTKAAMGGTADPVLRGFESLSPLPMLAQCRTHGYYRGENCPLCDTPGRVVMKDFEIDRVGRMMAGILRHFP